MKQQQAGFTLIELIAVIVILGILAAVAVPRFVNLQDSARQAAVDGTAAQLGAASRMNHAANLLADAGNTAGDAPVATTNCTQIALLLEGGVLDAQYTITAAAIGANEGDSATCTVTVTGTALTATFLAYNVQ